LVTISRLQRPYFTGLPKLKRNALLWTNLNTGTVLGGRSAPEAVRALEEIKSWNWDAGKITRNLESIGSANLDTLRTAT